MNYENFKIILRRLYAKKDWDLKDFKYLNADGNPESFKRLEFERDGKKVIFLEQERPAKKQDFNLRIRMPDYKIHIEAHIYHIKSGKLEYTFTITKEFLAEIQQEILINKNKVWDNQDGTGVYFIPYSKIVEKGLSI